MSKYFSFYLFAILFVASAFYLPTNDDWKEKLTPQLLLELERNDAVDCIIVFQEQASTAKASIFKNKEERGAFIYQKLQQVARRSQQNVQQILASKNINFQSYSVANVIGTKADLALLEQIARLPEVKHILHNPQVEIESLEEAGNSDFRNGAAIEWGIENINADDVWAMGFKGQNVVIGGQDTGFEWEHSALINSYRGWDSLSQTAAHDYNWHDAIREINPLHGDSTLEASNNPCGLDVDFPCDDHNHGTHTMGTMTGDDGDGNQIGVAPAAKWIACRNMERGWGTPLTYMECYEWFIAPTDLNNENPDPSKAPHVINNSWGCPAIEGCDSLHIALLENVVNNVKAAGIVVVVSAGNSGSSGCSSVSNPSAIYESSFTVGSIRQNDTISGFSSRGPAIQLDSTTFLLKPNVSAPGSNVRSSIRGGNYANFSGTSMAGPHVAGAVALLISANPELAGQVEVIEDILEQTARPMFAEEDCGNLDSLAIPNNTYGYGIIDVQAAVQMALEYTSIKETNFSNIVVNTYPNPFDEQVRFEFSGLESEVSLEIYDTNGQLMLSHVLARQNEFVEISAQHWASGIYFYTLKNEGVLLEGKIIRK